MSQDNLFAPTFSIDTVLDLLPNDPLAITRNRRVRYGAALAGIAALAAVLPLGQGNAGTPSALAAPAPVAAARVTAPAHASRSVARPALQPRTVTTETYRQLGWATWYGPGFHGRRTANGEIFNSGAMTAAHRTLPFNTRLKVCTKYRCVQVRINDRGPFGRGRIVDLSRAAAAKLGMERAGTMPVTITVHKSRVEYVAASAAIAAPPAMRAEARDRVSVVGAALPGTPLASTAGQAAAGVAAGAVVLLSLAAPLTRRRGRLALTG